MIPPPRLNRDPPAGSDNGSDTDGRRTLPRGDDVHVIPFVRPHR